MNPEQLETSRALLGAPTVEMLLQVHEDALWMLENLGVGCAQPEMLAAFAPYEADGKAIVYENRVYVTADLVAQCLAGVPGIDDFFVPRNSFLVGGTAPYVYDDVAGQAGLMPTADHVARIARMAEASPVVAGMGRGLKLKDEVEQMEIMSANCTKPLYFAVTAERSLKKAGQLYAERRWKYHGRLLPDPTLSGGQREFFRTFCAGGPGRPAGLYLFHAACRYQRPVLLQRGTGQDPRRGSFRDLCGPRSCAPDTSASTAVFPPSPTPGSNTIPTTV